MTYLTIDDLKNAGCEPRSSQLLRSWHKYCNAHVIAYAVFRNKEDILGHAYIFRGETRILAVVDGAFCSVAEAYQLIKEAKLERKLSDEKCIKKQMVMEEL